jgi:hypothetical protein
MFRKPAGILVLLVLLMCTSVCAKGDTSRVVPDTTLTEQTTEADHPAADQIVVTYFHGNRRCATCRKLEAYSREAIETGFQEELADSTLIWRTVNYDEEANKHFIEDYQLFTKALILSRLRDGEEVEFVNLDKIWELVRDREAFLTYVKTKTVEFMKSGTKE